jgi:hypothetical protein
MRVCAKNVSIGLPLPEAADQSHVLVWKVDSSRFACKPSYMTPALSRSPFCLAHTASVEGSSYPVCSLHDGCAPSTPLSTGLRGRSVLRSPQHQAIPTLRYWGVALSLANLLCLLLDVQRAWLMSPAISYGRSAQVVFRRRVSVLVALVVALGIGPWTTRGQPTEVLGGCADRAREDSHSRG